MKIAIMMRLIVGCLVLGSGLASPLAAQSRVSITCEQPTDVKIWFWNLKTTHVNGFSIPVSWTQSFHIASHDSNLTVGGYSYQPFAYGFGETCPSLDTRPGAHGTGFLPADPQWKTFPAHIRWDATHLFKFKFSYNNQEGMPNLEYQRPDY